MKKKKKDVTATHSADVNVCPTLGPDVDLIQASIEHEHGSLPGHWSRTPHSCR